MHLLFSGEGPSDLGVCNPALPSCDFDTFQPGPVAWMIDQWVEHCQGYEFSYISNGMVRYVSKNYLVANKPEAQGKRMRLPGKKKAKETGYYYNNARVIAQAAQKWSEELADRVIAILFRDGDGTASDGRGVWLSKYQSMLQGFKDENYTDGVALLANPKSEAWLLCAVKEDSPYQHCNHLEDESGNDRSQNPLKDQLAHALGNRTSSQALAGLVCNRTIDIQRIDMPSLNLAKEQLQKLLSSYPQN